MKALSLRPEWAMPVMLGDKCVECRTWATDYRGPLLICASAHKTPGLISGYALCKVELVDIEPFTDAHLSYALMDEAPDHAYAWVLDSVDWIEPVPVKGKLHLFEVPDELIRVIPETVADREAFTSFYLPLINMGRGDEWRKRWDNTIAAMAS